MIVNQRPRTDPIATHAYTLPVVREAPIAAGPSPAPSGGRLEQAVVYAADSHGW
jgi:hypothetical protein